MCVLVVAPIIKRGFFKWNNRDSVKFTKQTKGSSATYTRTHAHTHTHEQWEFYECCKWAHKLICQRPFNWTKYLCGTFSCVTCLPAHCLFTCVLFSVCLACQHTHTPTRTHTWLSPAVVRKFRFERAEEQSWELRTESCELILPTAIYSTYTCIHKRMCCHLRVRSACCV